VEAVCCPWVVNIDILMCLVFVASIAVRTICVALDDAMGVEGVVYIIDSFSMGCSS